VEGVTHWVVVGAGTAGTVVAARLLERPEVTVTLLEAGPTTPRPVGDDFTEAFTWPGRLHDLPVQRTAGGPLLPYRRGRGVGGSGSVNAMVALVGGPFRAEHRLPVEAPEPVEIGPIGHALLAAAPDARPAPLTRRHGHRVSTVETYLEPAREHDPDRLRVVGDATVARVLVRGRRAVGVELADGRTIDGDRVVLCAGAIHTPAVLLRSGVDTPGVGEGLQDHPSTVLTLGYREGLAPPPGSLVVGALLERGPHQVLPLDHLGVAAPGYGALMPALMVVHSRGAVRLGASADDPTAPPEVRFDLLRDDRDTAGLLGALRLTIELLDHPAFAAIVEEVYVDDRGTTLADLLDRHPDDAGLAGWLPTHVADYVHASSTCRLGTTVDDTGLLRGYEHLYVCDASVFPTVPPVNTNLPTVMLAEHLVTTWARLGR
jgi:choline dehydrogenase/5-(hydroxymethyl)furfural/furfural oxidase